jgi:triacylglycerol lipase
MDSHGPWFAWLAEAVLLSVGAAAAFVAGTYLFALLLTRGRFGWPGFGYFGREALWVLVTQALLPFGWFGSNRLGSMGVGAGLRRTRSLGNGNGAIADGADVAAPATRPIVFIHGYTQNRANFVWLARALERRGLGPFYGFNYHSLRRIESSATALGTFVEGVVRDTGATEVDFVCHSLGGVVARVYVDLLGGDCFVRRVVTLGSPHRGVLLASRLFGASIRDLHSRTGIIARLEATRSKVVVHSIYSSHDNIVFPGTSASLGERGTDVVVRRHGHLGILFSSEVADHVCRALVAPEPASVRPEAAEHGPEQADSFTASTPTP